MTTTLRALAVPRASVRDQARAIERALPPHPRVGWLRLPPVVVDGAAPVVSLAFRRADDGLGVLVSVDPGPHPGVRWLHVSASYPDRVPGWYAMCEVKDAFIGAERMAVQLHPPRSQYVNAHPHALHLWCNLDGPTVVDEEAERELVEGERRG